MYEEDILSERVAFRLTAATQHKLIQWARQERRPLANLIYVVVCQALAAEETRRGESFAASPDEGEA
ncbi:MAG: hypothetical protein H6671_18230 [Anaerolineaceae bacterium]|nr:hypothetical protein [Anaerolineaceae bacterium]